MNVSKSDIEAIRVLLSKEDRELIAELSGNSIRTVQAVLQNQRSTDIVQKIAIQVALKKWNTIGQTLNIIQQNNKEFANINDLREAKSSTAWARTREYNRYIDIYLQLTAIKWTDINELWKKLKTDFSDILQFQYYSIDLLTRLMGINEKTAINYFNQNI